MQSISFLKVIRISRRTIFMQTLLPKHLGLGSSCIGGLKRKGREWVRCRGRAGHFIYLPNLLGYCWPSLLLEQWERPINLSICTPLCHNIFSPCQQKNVSIISQVPVLPGSSCSCIITLLPLTTCMIVFLTVYYFVSTFQYTLFLNCHFCPTHPNSHSSVYHNNH